MKKAEIKSMEINGVEYVRKDSIKDMKKAPSVEGMEHCIVRTNSAGVFAGFVKSRNLGEVEMVNARRLWQWSGAASLSQLAVDGTQNPKSCKFPCEVPFILLLGVIEIIPTSKKAKESIDSVKIWEV